MRTDLHCEVIQTAPFEWYYVLENPDSAGNSWDWRGSATAVGPFGDEASADDHLRSSLIDPIAPVSFPLDAGAVSRDMHHDPILQGLIAQAHRPQQAARRWRW